MDGRGLDVSTEVSVKRMPITEHHNHSGANSSCSLFSENVNGEVPTSVPDISQRIEMLKVNAVRTKKVEKVNDLGCEGDNISCISKADGTNLETSGHLAETEQKNLTGSSASVTSFCQEPEKPIDAQSINHGCISSECIAEEGNKRRGSPEFARETIQSIADISDRSDPSETSSLRDEQGAVSRKVESVLPDGGTDLLTSQKGGHDCTDLWKADAEIDSNVASTVALNKLDQKQHSDMRMIHDMQEPPLQYRAIGENEDSDELVDVRVCDICGDVGREALLAICSKCNDGAEHIYCMRIKMDKVPGGDWMCEDCTTIVEAQNQKAEEQKIGRPLQKSNTNEVAQTSRKLGLSGDSGRVRMGHTPLASSRKRPGPNVDLSTSSKRRALDSDIKLSSPRSFVKALSPRHANFKIPTKAELASPSGRNHVPNVLRKGHEMLPGRSLKVESQLQKSSLFKEKFSNGTDLRTDRESEDVHREQKTAKGNTAFGAGQQHALTKLTKSKSFTTSSFASIDRNDSKKNMDSDFKIPKVGSKRSITQRSYSFNAKISQSVSPNGNSSSSVVKPAKATPAPLEVKQRVAQKGHHAAKTAAARKELGRATIHGVAKRQCDANGSGFDRKTSSSLADKGRRSGTSGRTSIISHGQKADRNAANVEEELKLKDAKHQLNDTDKVQLNSSLAGATVVLASSAHPDVDCIWRGMFNLECNKLPSCCSGLQAHLSTSASHKAFDVASNLPCEISVKEVLQQDIWPVQFTDNRVTENDIALYFFAEDNESYRRYKRFLNCMMLNDLALMANLDGIELLIFHSHVLPARSRRWNNLFFLWGVFKAKKSSYPDDDVYVPSPCECIQVPTSEIVTLPQNPPTPIPTVSEPINPNVSTQIEPRLPATEAVSGSVLGSGCSSPKELQSSVFIKSKQVEEIPATEVDCKAVESELTEKEQDCGGMQTAFEVQKENTSLDQDPEVKPVEQISAEPTDEVEIMKDVSLVTTEEKHQAETALNYPSNNGQLTTINVNVPAYTNGFLGNDDDMNGRSTISLNSSPSNSEGTAMEHHHHPFNLELPFLSENEPAIEGDSEMAVVADPNHDADADADNVEGVGFVSLDLSLALPSADNDPVPMMEDPLPEMDDVDTSLSLSFGGKKA